MSILLQYDIPTGIRNPTLVQAKVAAIQYEQGELELLGAVVIDDQTLVDGNFVRKFIQLEFTGEGLVNFPTPEEQVLATIDLYRGAFSQGTPAIVFAEPPAVVAIPVELLAGWYSADTGVVVFGGDVSSWSSTDGDAGPFEQPVVLERPDSLENDPRFGLPSVSFPGTEHLISSDPAAFWTFLHDGTGMTVAFVTNPFAAAVKTFFSTRTGANPGVRITWTNTFWRFFIDNGVDVFAAQSAAGVPGPTVNQYVIVRHSAGQDMRMRVNGQDYTGPAAGPFSANPPHHTAMWGSSVISTELPLAEALIFRADLTDAQVNAVVSYFESKYTFP